MFIAPILSIVLSISNPLEVIEQFTYLLFIKGLDEVETKNEAEAMLLGVPYDRIFNDEQQHLRWSKFANEGNAEKMYEIVQNEVFPFIRFTIMSIMCLGVLNCPLVPAVATFDSKYSYKSPFVSLSFFKSMLLLLIYLMKLKTVLL